MVLLSRQVVKTIGGGFLDWVEREYERARSQGDTAQQARLEPLYVASLTEPNIKTDELEGVDARIYEEWLAGAKGEQFGRPFGVILVEILPPEEFAQRRAGTRPGKIRDDDIFGFGEDAVDRARVICREDGKFMWGDHRKPLGQTP